VVSIAALAAGCGPEYRAPTSADRALLDHCAEFREGLPPGVAPAELVHAPRPQPPPPEGAGEAFACIEGEIDEEGRVGRTRVLRTNDEAFAALSLEAAQAHRYRPARRDGSPVAVRMVFAFSFRRNVD
jgi:hypothetical protein